MTTLDTKQLAKYIDHTYLKQDATVKEITALCEEAMKYGFYSVCVNSSWVPHCVELLSGSEVKVAAVAGFPLGAMSTAAKAFEAAEAAEQGAAEIDMVLPIGKLLQGDLQAVGLDIRRVVDAVRGRAIVKVIMETGYLNDEQKRLACHLSEEAGAHYVKTSTGFGPGGATVQDILLMRASVSAGIGVKASGGVRDYETALRMIEAGATRIGTSSGAGIVSGAPSTGSGGY